MPQSIINAFSVIISHHEICLFQANKALMGHVLSWFIEITYFCLLLQVYLPGSYTANVKKASLNKNALRMTLHELVYVIRDHIRITQLAFAGRKNM